MPMRIFAISDVHADYAENFQWLQNLSLQDFTQDVLILAGDIGHSLTLLAKSLEELRRRFAQVLFVPGNHDLWSMDDPKLTSFDKFHAIRRIANENGVLTEPYRTGELIIIPLLSWYDYSFGQPSQRLRDAWADYRYCKWPEPFTDEAVTTYFLDRNPMNTPISGEKVVTFSHFLPRIDIMPRLSAPVHRMLYPVLGSGRIDQQIRQLGAVMHVYGHSHLNRRVSKHGVTYINNAYGYPKETAICAKSLLCIYDDGELT